MIEFLCENYPHLADNVFDKMPYDSIQKMRRMPSILKDFINNRKNYIFMYDLSIASPERYLDGKVERMVEINSSNEVVSHDRDFQKLLEKNQLSRAFVRDVHVLLKEDLEHKKMILKNIERFKNTVFSKKLSINIADQNTAANIIETFNPEEVSIDRLTLTSDEFLQLPALQDVRVLSMDVFSLNTHKINLRKVGKNLRSLELQCTASYRDEIINFVQDFIDGRQTINRLVIFGQSTPKIAYNFSTIFEENAKEESENIFRITTSEEEAFVSLNNDAFFFRSMPKMEKEKLQKYFDMAESGMVGPNDYYNESLLSTEDLDESITSESNTDVSRLSSGFSELSFTE